MADKKADMRTPLSRVKGLGAAGHGVEHWWLQRVTAVANIPLIIAFVIIVAVHDALGDGADNRSADGPHGRPRRASHHANYAAGNSARCRRPTSRGMLLAVARPAIRRFLNLAVHGVAPQLFVPLHCRAS